MTNNIECRSEVVTVEEAAESIAGLQHQPIGSSSKEQTVRTIRRAQEEDLL